MELLAVSGVLSNAAEGYAAGDVSPAGWWQK